MTRKRNETEGLEETKLPVFKDDIFFKNQLECREKLLEVIGEFGKIARYKKNLQKPIAFFYYSNNQLKKKKRKEDPFKIAT